MRKSILCLLIILGGVTAHRQVNAQIRQVPAAVEDAFTQQYPDADSVKYDDKLVYVLVRFNKNDSLSTARYTSKGLWQWTETAVPFSSLPEEIQTGFNKSKYVGWQLDHVYLVDLPGRTIQYKLQVEKSAVQKRNLVFNKRGRLVSDNITMY